MLLLLRHHGVGVTPPTPPEQPPTGHSVSRRVPTPPPLPVPKPRKVIRPALVYLDARLQPATARFDITFTPSDDEELLLLLT